MKKFLVVTGNTILVVMLAIGIAVAFSALPIKKNYKIYLVTSGSMKPTIAVGSMIVSAPRNSYAIGDIITFRDQEIPSQNNIVTHRIVEINTGEQGEYVYTTKGDANNVVDGQYLNDSTVIGKMVIHIPWIGYVVGYVKTLPGLIFIIIVPSVIIIYEEVKKIHRETKKIVGNKKKTKHPNEIKKQIDIIKRDSGKLNNIDGKGL